jgi:hypothetical protein
VVTLVIIVLTKTTGETTSMEPHFNRPPPETPEQGFPVLPIINPGGESVPRPDRDRYGGLYWLGLIGLAIVLALLAWFAWGAWSLRAVWGNVYVLHDPHRSDAERIAAAFALSRDKRVNQRQLWDISLRRSLPPLARYIVANALTAEAVTADPRGYTLAVARSTGWPVWLRLLLARPMAYAAAQGTPLPADVLRELRDRDFDPAITLWADFCLAAGRPADPESQAHLERAAARDTPYRPFSALLHDALQADSAGRLRRLDEATRWLRTHHPEAIRVWSGWTIKDDRLVPVLERPKDGEG